MPTYAVIDGIKIINIIQAASVQDAESATGFSCVEYTTETAEPGGTYENGKFIKIQPYPSWTLDEEYKWQAPVPYPDESKLYIWSEETTSWIEVEPTIDEPIVE